MENKSKLNTILLVIITILLAIILVYIFLFKPSFIEVNKNSQKLDLKTQSIISNKNDNEEPSAQTTSNNQVPVNNGQQSQTLSYKQQNDPNVGIKFSYPSNWSIKATNGQYDEVSSYILQPNTLNTNDQIILDLNGSNNACYFFDDINSNIYNSSKAYLYNIFDVSNGIYFDKQNIYAIGEFVGKGDCLSIYTKSTNQSVLIEFYKIVLTLKSNSN